MQRNPRIAGTAAAAETAVWLDFRASQQNIYSATLAAGGSAWAANKRVSDNTSASVAKDFPDAAVGASRRSCRMSHVGNPTTQGVPKRTRLAAEPAAVTNEYDLPTPGVDG